MIDSEDQPVPRNESLVDARAIAKHLGMHPVTVARLAKRGTIPSLGYKNGARTFLRFRVSAVEAALSIRRNS